MQFTVRQSHKSTNNLPSRMKGLLDGSSLDHDSSIDLGELSKSHPYWLVKGDAFDLVKLLPRDSIDLLITSPPYWGQRTYGQPHNWDTIEDWNGHSRKGEEIPSYKWYRERGGLLGLEPLPDWYIHHLVEFFNEAGKALKPGGSLWINIGDTYYARWSSIRDKGRQGLGENDRIRRRTPMGGYRQEKNLLMIPARFAIKMQEHRWILRNDLIWHKPNVPPRPERDRLRLSHEHFFHFVKRPTEGRAKYYYDLAEVEPSQNDVVTYNVKAGVGDHSATFPQDLIAPRIFSSCPPSGVVLDPFCGVGTAIVVAVMSGRKAIGFDLVEDFLISASDSLHKLRLPYEKATK